MFEIKGKVALVTGGASGIGFHCVQALLENGLKGATLVDINVLTGQETSKYFENHFGPDKVLFAKTDITHKEEVEVAFRKTVEKFGNIDIVVNSAGILNESHWEKEVAINLNGVINTMILGMDKYLPKYHQGTEAVILNVSSLSGIRSYYSWPIYAATKHGVLGLTKGWGHEKLFQKTNIRVIAVCPGPTNTAILDDYWQSVLPGPLYKPIGNELHSVQQPTDVAKEMIDILKYATTGTVWVVKGGEPAFQYVFPDIDSMKGNVLLKTERCSQ